MYVTLGLHDNVVELLPIDVTDEDHVDNPGIHSPSVIPGQVNFLQIAQPLNHRIGQLVDTGDLADHGGKLREKGVLYVGPVIDVSPVFLGHENLVFREVVELHSDGIGGDLEFGCKLPEICLGRRV